MDKGAQGHADINAFLRVWRAYGFRVGVEQHLTAERLLLTLAARGELPEDASTFSSLIAPIICTSGDEQASFHRLYKEWTSVRPEDGPAVGASSTIEGASETEPASPPRAGPVADRPRILNWGLGLLIAAAVVVLYLLLRPEPTPLPRLPSGPSSLSGNVRDEATGAVLANAKIKVIEQVPIDQFGQPVRTPRTRETTSDAGGGYDVSVEGLSPPFNADASLDGYLSIGSKAFKDASDIKPTDFLLRVNPEENRNWLWQVVIKVALALGLVLVGSMAFLAGRRRLYLKKWRTADSLRTIDLVISPIREHLTQMFSLRVAIQKLQRRRLVQSGELDAALTVEAMLEAGVLVPVYGVRKTAPKYLVLLNRSAPEDHLSRMEDEVVRHLVKNGVYVDRYYFNSDPRLCWKARGGGRGYTLAALAASHPDHNLMIFDDGSSFFDPLTGRLSHWLTQFYNWPMRAVLTPNFLGNEYREGKLSDMGFLVLPATGKGMAVLGEVLGEGSRRERLADSRDDALPPILRTRVTRWVEEYAPTPDVVEDLCAQLRTYLGAEGYYWLLACAVYPMLNWDLTLSLGYELLGYRQVADRLPRLVRLPWFQHGSMPNWLRDALISKMLPAQGAKVKETLDEILVGGSRSPHPGGFALTIARKQRLSESVFLRSPLGEAKRIAEGHRRPSGSDNTWAAPAVSPLRDYVFMSFMFGVRQNRLFFLVPRELQTSLIPGASTDLVMLFTRFPMLSVLMATLLIHLYTAFSLGSFAMGTIAICMTAALTFIYILAERDLDKSVEAGAMPGQGTVPWHLRGRSSKTADVYPGTVSSVKVSDTKPKGERTRRRLPSLKVLYEYVSEFWYVDKSWPRWFTDMYLASATVIFAGAVIGALLLLAMMAAIVALIVTLVVGG